MHDDVEENFRLKEEEGTCDRMKGKKEIPRRGLKILGFFSIWQSGYIET